MSHFTTIKTKIFDTRFLLETLGELNHEISHEKILIGYNGRKFNVDFQINLHGKYNIGFVKKGRSYDIVGDLYFVPNSRELIGKIKQLYSKKIVMKNIQKLGYRLVEEKTSNDTIQMVVRRR